MFKVGDKVERIDGWHLGMTIGDKATIAGFRVSGVTLREFEGTHATENLKLVEPAEKTWQTLAKGDVIVRGNTERTIVERLGDVVFCLENGLFTSEIEFGLVPSLEKDGYTIKQPEKPEEFTEMTVSECAKKLGVKNLKIVE